jgi:hypothetical protein
MERTDRVDRLKNTETKKNKKGDRRQSHDTDRVDILETR